MRPNEERSNILVSFSGYCSPKLALPITTNQSACSRFISKGSASLKDQDPENNTDDSGRFFP